MNLEEIHILSYNKKLIYAAELALASFYKGTLLLCDLENELRNIIESFQDISDEAKQKLIMLTNRLDAIYAFIVIEDRDFTADDWNEINKNIAYIRQFFDEYKKKYDLDNFDEEYEEYKFLYPDK